MIATCERASLFDWCATCLQHLKSEAVSHLQHTSEGVAFLVADMHALQTAVNSLQLQNMALRKVISYCACVAGVLPVLLSPHSLIRVR